MNGFVFLYRGGEAGRSPERAQQAMQQWMAWFKELAAKGHIKDQGVHARRRQGRHLHTELQGRRGGLGPHRKPTSLEGKPHGRAVHSGRATLAALDTTER